MPKKGELTKLPKQQLAIEALVVGQTDAAAADAAGVSKKTIERWRKEAGFQKEFLRLLENRKERISIRIGILAEAATKAVQDAFQAVEVDGSVNHAIRLRAAEASLGSFTKVTQKTDVMLPTGPLLAFPPGTQIALVAQPAEPPILSLPTEVIDLEVTHEST